MDSDTPIRKSIPKPTNAIAKRIWKGSEKIEHSLFKLAPATHLKNVSYQPFKPKIENVSHTHFFHSVDRKGKANTYCAPMAGHFHKVTALWEGDDLKSVECGPAIRYKWRQDRRGNMYRNLEGVLYKGEAEDGSQDKADKHTHSIEYVRSEIIPLGKPANLDTQALFAGQKRHSDEAMQAAKQALSEK